MVRDNRLRGADPVHPTVELEPDRPDWGQAPYALASRLTVDFLDARDTAIAAGHEPPAPTGSDFQQPGTRRWYPTTYASPVPQSRISRPATPYDDGTSLEPGSALAPFVFGS